MTQEPRLEEHLPETESRVPGGGIRDDRAGRLSAMGWGLFALWIGVVFLTAVPGWVALLGVAAITLGIQAARLGYGFALERFWAGVGALFLIGALWEISGTTLPLLPILLMVAGIALIVSVFRRRQA